MFYECIRILASVFECYSNVLKCSLTGQTLDCCRALGYKCMYKIPKAQQLDRSWEVDGRQLYAKQGFTLQYQVSSPYKTAFGSLEPDMPLACPAQRSCDAVMSGSALGVLALLSTLTSGTLSCQWIPRIWRRCVAEFWCLCREPKVLVAAWIWCSTSKSDELLLVTALPR